MKKLYICGDSFACLDPESTILPWPQILKDKIKESWNVTNLSMVCASNLNIRMQIDNAIENNADFIIVLFTSSLRGNGRLTDNSPTANLLDNFFKIGQYNKNKNLACWSYGSLNLTCVLPKDKIKILKEYYAQIFDLGVEVYQNQCVIESTLFKLVNSQCAFLFDQGGFENPLFNGHKEYFKEFDPYRSQYNLWTMHGKRQVIHRPYFHIIDQDLHDLIANYYYQELCRIS